MRINNFLLALPVTMIIVGLNAQTTGLTDDFSNEANSLIILSSGMGMDIEYPVSGSDSRLAMIMNKSIENEELVIDYHWISDAAYNEIRITPPNGTTFDFSSSGQFLTFDYRVGTLFPITFGFKDTSENFTESQTIILEGNGLTHTASFAINTTVPNTDYSNIDYIQLILNRGSSKLNSDVANCILHIDNLVIGDGEFDVANSDILNLSKPTEIDVLVYPNPTMGVINISSEELLYAYKIYNIIGRVQSYQKLDTPLLKTKINLSEWKKGMYIIEIFGRNSKSEYKIIVN